MKVALSLILVAIWFMFLGYLVGRQEGYQSGQLDYQRGIIQYELTDNGYIQHFEGE